MTSTLEERPSGSLAIEIGELVRKYAALRIADPARQSRLTASICAHGQQTPVVVVPHTADRYVLIDGHGRVVALESLSRDLVDALVWPLSEAQALVLSLRFELSRRRTALEDGWLLHELIAGHGQQPAELALALQRSVSWISRRLALVRVVPEAVQAAVRRGQVPAQAAMKSLVPLARAKAAHCERLVAALAGRSISVRQLATLYQGWRAGDAEQRERLVDHPWLYLKAQDETAGREPLSEPTEGARLETLMETLVSLARQASRALRHGVLRRAATAQRRAIEACCPQLALLLTEIERLIAEENDHARPRPPGHDPASPDPGSRDPHHCPHPEGVAQGGTTGAA
jgi:ParB/RepB/Spo0J family partition protein